MRIKAQLIQSGISGALIKISMLLLTGVLSSCSGMMFTSIDVLRPAKVVFPTEVTNIVVVNNTLKQPHDFGHTTHLFNAKSKKDTINTDSLALFCIASLAESMLEKEFFNSVQVELNSINKNLLFFSPEIPVFKDVSNLATTYLAEGVVSLNRILVQDDLAEMYNQSNSTFVAYLEARYETRWSIHFPLVNQKYEFTLNDTVYWESESFSRQRAINGLPNRKDALIDGALIAGSRAVNSFIPYWEEVDRYLFTMRRKDFRQAYDSIYRKQWDGAISIFNNSLLSAKSNLTKARIAHNLSVLHEINGDVNTAYDFSNKAMTYIMETAVINYKHLLFINEQNEALQRRKEEVLKVKRQLGETVSIND